jgi:hypothetical protein
MHRQRVAGVRDWLRRCEQAVRDDPAGAAVILDALDRVGPPPATWQPEPDDMAILGALYPDEPPAALRDDLWRATMVTRLEWCDPADHEPGVTDAEIQDALRRWLEGDE